MRKKLNEEELEKTVGGRLRLLRLRANLTQSEVAEKVFMESKNYSKYENNITSLSIERLCEFADLYDVSLEYIARGIERDINVQIAHMIQKCPFDKRKALLEIVRLYIESVS